MKRKIRDPKRAESARAQGAGARARSSARERPRLTVFRSAKHIYAQLIDDERARRSARVSTRSKARRRRARGDRQRRGARSRSAQAIAALAREKQIEEVVFDRNGFLYHGRVKALADAAREAGLKF